MEVYKDRQLRNIIISVFLLIIIITTVKLATLRCVIRQETIDTEKIPLTQNLISKITPTLKDHVI